MKLIPRWCHRAYAFAFGYFWTACPACGRMFGGHEKSGGSVPDRDRPERVQRICCADCPTPAYWRSEHGIELPDLDWTKFEYRLFIDQNRNDGA